MLSTFFGIETMKTAILTQRKIMDTIGHNVANASTEGYSRQVVNLAARTSYTANQINSSLYGAGQIGTGVIATAIERIRDVYVDKQLRTGTSDKGYNDIAVSTLSQIENAFMEPSTDEGLSAAMTEFFSAWSDLADNPESLAARNQVISTANNLVDVIHTIDQALRDIRIDLDSQINEDVEQVNKLLYQIADLNDQIADIYANGYTPNDLLDSRDLLLDELSTYVNYSVSDTDTEGMIAIDINGRELVRNTTVYELTTESSWDHPSQDTKTPYMTDVSQSDFDMLAQMSSGELKGLVDARDDILLNVQSQFTEMVNTLVNTVNNYFSQGIGTNLEDYGVVATTTSTIGNLDNFVTVAASDMQYFSTGDKIYIGDADGEGITVTITDVDYANSRLFFDNVGILSKGVETAASTYTSTAFTVDSGAEIRRITLDKENFFELQSILGGGLIGDTSPDFYSQMTSTITLPDSVTLKTTVKQLEEILGVNITDNINGSRVQLNDTSYSKLITEDMTIDTVLLRLSQENLANNDGKGLSFTFDEVNHKIIVTGETAEALDQLGGEDGSSCNILRILGLEGYGITGIETQSGTELTTTLQDLGVGSGYIQIDNCVIELDETMTLQSALDTINGALNTDPSQKSYGTNIFFDTTSGRVRVVSSHEFCVTTPEVSQFPVAGSSVTTSNFLTVLGLQREESTPTDALVQGLASVTSSDTGARITVNQALVNDVGKLSTALSYAGIPGDNAGALNIAGVDTLLTMGSLSSSRESQPTLTINDYYNSLISGVGTLADEANTNANAIDNFIEYYSTQKEAVSGVSIDEEMVKMIEAQHAFSAASRMINTIDEMLNLIISGTGLAGR